MRSGIGSVCGLAVVVVGALALAGDAQEATRTLGKVKSVEKDGSGFELTEKRGTVKVTLGAGAAVIVHKAVALGECEDGADLHVLARKQESTRDPQSGATLPEQIVQIIAIVVGKSFTPPDIPADLATKKVGWISGQLRKTEKELALDRTKMTVGRDRPSVALENGDAAAIAKGKIVRVEGTREGSGKTAEIKATRVTVLSPQIPAADYRAILGD
jgi:hypothetical protein